MNIDEFRKNGYRAVDWVADYLENIEKYPVKSQVNPGDIYDKIPSSIPLEPESAEACFSDLDEIILPGITHWQHPNFHAYFPGNSSEPSFLAEILTAGIGAQCMVWETSPAAAELEEKMMEWIKSMMGLPESWEGVIQDTASTATLVALLTAREKYSDFSVNKEGFETNNMRIYCSQETHSSIDKAVKIAGFGIDNLIKIEVNENLGMNTDALETAIQEDLKDKKIPCAVVGASGTTGTLAFDDLQSIGELCEKYGIWFHVDAAYAGSAMLLPEKRHLFQGAHLADSYVFNPHKWLFTNFDCTAYFVKDSALLRKTFEILPEYLKNATRGEVNDYRDWGIQLGRRFRALKLWFVFRQFGLKGLQEKLRNHISFAQWINDEIDKHSNFELLTPQELNVVVFRFCGRTDKDINVFNEKLLSTINQSGKAFLSHTKVDRNYAIRLVTGQTHLTLEHVQKVWTIILETADLLQKQESN